MISANVEAKINPKLFEFIPATQRVRTLKQAHFEITPELCIERARIYTKADMEYADQPIKMKRALCLAKVLEEMSIYINPGELIVGNQARKDRAAPVFPEFSVSWLEDELDTLYNRAYDPFVIVEEEKPEWREIIAYWKGKTNVDKARALTPEKVAAAKKSGILLGEHVIQTGHGHLAPYFSKLFKLGLNGYIKEIDDHLEKLDVTKQGDLEKITFLKSVRIIFEASIAYANRYADLAEQQAQSEPDAMRKQELMLIAKNCRNVPANPPQSFMEAVQVVWFVMAICQIESNGHSYSIGRLDQDLYAFYAADVEKGVITPEQAQEILACLFIKLHSTNKVRGLSHTVYSAGYPMYQNICIGGQKNPGVNAENDLSYLIINAMENVRFPEPNLVARLWPGSSPNFLRKIAQSLSLGFGMPAMLSDSAIIPSLLARGITKEDAYNYSSTGCIEVAVPGKWGYRCIGMTYVNFPKMFEIAMYGGIDPRNPDVKWPFEKSLSEMESFEEVKDAWRKSVEIFTRLEVENDAIADYCLTQLPEPFICGLVDDCIERGKPILEGGCHYDLIAGVQVGIANLANTLAGIKKLVFDDKYMTGAEMLEILSKNFDVENGEYIRQKMLNEVPKYGNDDDYVDELAVWAYGVYSDEIEKYKTTRDGLGPEICGYTSSTITISTHIGTGKVTGATPDGRKAGEPLSEGASPWAGSDINGPTAVMKSEAKIPTIRMTGGQLLNLKFNDAILTDEAEQTKLMDLIRAFFFELHGWHIQVNAVSPETLLDAQVHPEQHRDLMVRVAGYCALFTELDRDIQNEIISRTTHSTVG